VIDDPGPVDGDDPGDAMPGLTVPPVPEVSTAARVAEIIAHWFEQAVTGARRVISKPGTVWTDQPCSLAHIHRYHRSGEWVPPGHPWQVFMRWEGQAFGHTIGTAGPAIGYAFAWWTKRQIHFWPPVIIAAIVALAAWAASR
jgi:hypothetical protein